MNVSRIDIPALTELWMAQVPLEEMCKRLGIAAPTVRLHAKRAGLPFRQIDGRIITRDSVHWALKTCGHSRSAAVDIDVSLRVFRGAMKFYGLDEPSGPVPRAKPGPKPPKHVAPVPPISFGADEGDRLDRCVKELPASPRWGPERDRQLVAAGDTHDGRAALAEAWGLSVQAVTARWHLARAKLPPAGAVAPAAYAQAVAERRAR